MTDMVKFKGAGLPAAGIAQYKQAIQAARDQVSVGVGGLKYLRLGKDDGVWLYGQEDTEIETGSLWAINPTSLEIGVIAWPPAKSTLKEPIKKMRRIFDVNAPVIDKAQLAEPANGGVWDDCVSLEMQCVGGVDEKGKPYEPEDLGMVICYQQNSYGGKQVFDEVAKELMLQLDRDPRLIVPVIELKSESYQHNKWGTVWKPIFEITKWVAMDGTSGEPEEEEEEQPKASPQADAAHARARAAEAEKEAEPEKATGRGRGRRAAAAAAEPAADATQEQASSNGAVRRRRRT